MTTRSILRAATFVACGALAGAAWAGPQAGERTFSLSGTGSSDDSFDSTVLGAMQPPVNKDVRGGSASTLAADPKATTGKAHSLYGHCASPNGGLG